jgi:hypothetical protein
MSLQLAAASYIYIHYALKKRKKNSGGGGKRSCTQTGMFTVIQVY